MMNGLAFLMALASAGASIVSGTVTSPNGGPVPGAQVFIEPGLDGAVQSTRAGTDGSFRFDDVPPGPCGVFAIAEGFGFGGEHANLAIEENATGLAIRLAPETTVAGRVTSAEGDALEGAVITRIALTAPTTVGIPLSKLEAFGHPVVRTNAEGRFELRGVPEGSTLALKVGHASYAQEGVNGVAAGDHNLHVQLYRGVLIEGEVIARGSGNPVANATVLVRNAQPPHDTSVTTSSARGVFSMRLKPGVYLYRAGGSDLQSPGWEKLRVTGETSQQKANLVVAGRARVTGAVKDAVSGRGIGGVRLTLYANGTRAAVQYTGPNGEYAFSAAEGECTIKLEAAPGYTPPRDPVVRVQIAGGEDKLLPEFWLAPLPKYAVTVVDGNGQGVSGAYVQLLRPAQLGWHQADASGQVPLHLSVLPSAGNVIGWAEEAGSARGALFSLGSGEKATGIAQLLDLGHLNGTVVDERGKALAGVLVGGVFPGETESDDPLLLWQCRTDKDGGFHWPAAAPQVPMRVLARDAKGQTGWSGTVTVDMGQAVSVGNIVVTGGSGGEAYAGTKPSHKDFIYQGGPEADVRALFDAPVLLLGADAASEANVIEAAAAAAPALAKAGCKVAVVVRSERKADGAAVTILRSSAMPLPSSWLVGADGRVVLDTAGLPPLAALHALLTGNDHADQ
ncbi:MAG: hypothetical protein GC168_04540 [Candidatus Hydrogenedens sp.]|nr:hypothetical protein [Candidatus Hydrogenedens sp.]